MSILIGLLVLAAFLVLLVRWERGDHFHSRAERLPHDIVVRDLGAHL